MEQEICTRSNLWLTRLALLPPDQNLDVKDHIGDISVIVLLLFQFVNPEVPGYVGFANLPNQVHRKSVKKGFEFTLMVVGKCATQLCFVFSSCPQLLSAALKAHGSQNTLRLRTSCLPPSLNFLSPPSLSLSSLSLSLSLSLTHTHTHFWKSISLHGWWFARILQNSCFILYPFVCWTVKSSFCAPSRGEKDPRLPLSLTCRPMCQHGSE